MFYEEVSELHRACTELLSISYYHETFDHLSSVAGYISMHKRSIRNHQVPMGKYSRIHSFFFYKQLDSGVRSQLLSKSGKFEVSKLLTGCLFFPCYRFSKMVCGCLSYTLTIAFLHFRMNKGCFDQ